MHIITRKYIFIKKTTTQYPGFGLDDSVEMRKDLRKGSRFCPLCQQT